MFLERFSNLKPFQTNRENILLKQELKVLKEIEVKFKKVQKIRKLRQKSKFYKRHIS